MQEIILSICLGIGLAASVGFRIFLPLFVLSLAGRFEMIPLNEQWEWISGTIAFYVLIIATLTEILAYYIPWFDNLLDTLAIPLAGIAGTAVMVSTVSDLSPAITWALGIIAGGGTAATIKSAMGITRLASTTSTGGLANPLITTIETGTSALVSIVAVLLAPVAILLVIFIFYRFRKVYKKLFSRTS